MLERPTQLERVRYRLDRSAARARAQPPVAEEALTRLEEPAAANNAERAGHGEC